MVEYRTPKPAGARLERQATDVELATRWGRLGGVCIDLFISTFIVIQAIIAAGYWQKGIEKETFAWTIAIHSAIGTIVFLLLNLYFIARRGQTIGKMIFNCRIVDSETGDIPAAWKTVFLRYMPLIILFNIPIVGIVLLLIDSLFICRKDRRCAHDLVSGTKVIRAGVARMTK